MQKPPQKNLIVITGPTAVGKTKLCIDLALHWGTEIISADSRQCYQGMKIGTAQPTTIERQTVPHHLIDCLPVEQLYSAGAYARDAHQILKRLFSKHDTVLMTGGTGLYIQAVCQGLAPIPPIASTYRQTLNQRLKQEGINTLLAELATCDPDYCKIVDKHNPQRIVRALEVCLATGKPYSSFRNIQHTKQPFNIIKIGLIRDRAELYQRIEERTEDMISKGLIEEATTLYPHRHHNALQTVGYRELFGYIDQEYDLQEAIRLLKRNTRRYAKRQITWLKRDPTMQWFHPEEKQKIMHYIQQHMR